MIETSGHTITQIDRRMNGHSARCRFKNAQNIRVRVQEGSHSNSDARVHNRTSTIYCFEVAKFIHKWVSKSLSNILYQLNMFTLITQDSGHRGIYTYLPQANSNLTKRSMEYSGIIILNALLKHIRVLSRERFKEYWYGYLVLASIGYRSGQ